MNFQMFKLVFRKGRGTRDPTGNICWIIKKAREFQKNIYFCFIDYAKAFDCVQFSFSSVQSLSHVWLFATSWIAARQASLSITNSQSLLKVMSIKSVMPSNHLILCCPFSSCLQSFPASGSLPMSQRFLVTFYLPKIGTVYFSVEVGRNESFWLYDPTHGCTVVSNIFSKRLSF